MADLPSPPGKKVIIGTAAVSSAAVLIFFQVTAFYAIMDAISTVIMCGIFYAAGRFTRK